MRSVVDHAVVQCLALHLSIRLFVCHIRVLHEMSKHIIKLS